MRISVRLSGAIALFNRSPGLGLLLPLPSSCCLMNVAGIFLQELVEIRLNDGIGCGATGNVHRDTVGSGSC